MTRRWRFAWLLGLLAIGDRSSEGQGTLNVAPPPLTAFDPRMEPIHRALTIWDAAPGPNRVVVDQVCLVPDLATYFEAIASWDDKHFFPVLFDEVESSFRFIRAFRPARIVRMPKSAAPFPPGKVWDRAVEVVGASWSAVDQGPNRPLGNAVPKTLGPTPPGLVFSNPKAPMLAGAVALAAGHFEPLLQLDSSKRFNDSLTPDEVEAFARAIARRVSERRLRYEGLGDECDFITLAAEYPFRYRDPKGDPEAVDDRIGRIEDSGQRWAYAGRLLGDPAESAYRAMCSLFLEPESAVMFNTYEERPLPWALYATRNAALRLNSTLPTSQVANPDAGLEGWHETFDPSNRFGLVMINSMGGSEMFGLQGQHGLRFDIPRGVPSAVLMIHSFSADDPTNPNTLAARWLANGAFVFYGSMYEPYVDAFRTPQLVSELLARGIPVVAAVRQLPGEMRGAPWRLVFLGDPLYRIRKTGSERPARLARWEPTSRWPAYSASPRPAPSASNPNAESELFLWALKSALANLQTPSRTTVQIPNDALVDGLLAIRREKLPPAYRPVYDALLIEVLFEARRRSSLKDRLYKIPVAERTPAVRRTLETIEAIDFYYVYSKKDITRATGAWLLLMKTDLSDDFKGQAMAMVALLATTPAGLAEWRDALKTSLQDLPAPAQPKWVADELKRVEDAIKK